MKNKHLILLVGNIASGKTTLSKKYVVEEYRVISRDAIRYMIGAGNYIFNVDLESIIRKGTLLLFEEFAKNSINVVYDEVNICSTLRKPVIEIAKKYKYYITAIVLKKLTKTKSVNIRLKNSHGQYDRDTWNVVWTNFNNMYEEPQIEEGIDEIINL